ncbi:hypothetical protein [Nisaea sp.]|uniref:hypothetical protein n=1 Tax=Nisaea sp. TaxID=2024842 RepID=UPI003297D0AB
MNRILPALFAATVTLPSAAAFAQDTSSSGKTVALKPITVTSATRTETPIDETTVSVTVITREEIEEQSSVNTPVG